MVRAHVRKASNAPDSSTGDWDRYLRVAADALHPKPPLLVAVGGLQGTGKSTLARALAPGLGGAPGALVLRSDETRKRLHHRAPEDRLPQDAYSDAANRAVDDALLRDAARTLAGGHAVVVDATCLDHGFRDALRQVAAQADAPFLGLWLQAPVGELERRIAARHGDASDATIDVLRRALQSDPGAGDWTAVPAENRDTALAAADAAIARLTGSSPSVSGTSEH
jgi:uncharacterized protein